MTILVTGSTGTIGKLILERLEPHEIEVRALVRDAAKAEFGEAVELVQGDMTDPGSMRSALEGVDTLFLLNAVVPDELTQALLTLDLAREAGIRRIVYFSVFNSAVFSDVPHFAGKRVVERVIDEQAIPATVLRPAYFFQNDAMFKDALLDGTYPQPIGSVGLTMVDARDIADAAVSELLRRERAPSPLPRLTLEVVGPETLSGQDLAKIWADVIGRKVRYAGDDLQQFEADAACKMPGWQAHDLRLMMRAFHSHGMVPGADAREVLEGVIDHPLRSYRAFAQELSEGW